MLGIEDFYALLTSEEGSSEGEETTLLAALRKLTEIARVEDVVEPIGPNIPQWW
jgi:hypothetical protein